MKLIKRIFLLICALTLVGTLTVTSLASEVENEELAYAESEITEENLDTGAAQEPDATEVNPFESAFSLVCDYSSEIFSALAFVGTLIVAHFYKKGMLPTLKGALTGVSRSLGAVSDKTEAALSPISERAEAISDTIDSIKGVVDTLSSSLLRVEGELSALCEGDRERAAYKTIMLSQVEMLYDIFMSSALPQYKKDEIGERIAAMREELKLCDESTK